jgi:hypothetical protein
VHSIRGCRKPCGGGRGGVTLCRTTVWHSNSLHQSRSTAQHLCSQAAHALWSTLMLKQHLHLCMALLAKPPSPLMHIWSHISLSSNVRKQCMPLQPSTVWSGSCTGSPQDRVPRLYVKAGCIDTWACKYPSAEIGALIRILERSCRQGCCRHACTQTHRRGH